MRKKWKKRDFFVFFQVGVHFLTIFSCFSCFLRGGLYPPACRAVSNSTLDEGLSLKVIFAAEKRVFSWFLAFFSSWGVFFEAQKVDFWRFFGFFSLFWTPKTRKKAFFGGQNPLCTDPNFSKKVKKGSKNPFFGHFWGFFTVSNSTLDERVSLKVTFKTEKRPFFDVFHDFWAFLGRF